MSNVVRVLVVDDSAFVRKTMRQILEASPFVEVVGTASDGLDALEKVAELTPDVITLDLIMPHLDGIGFLRKLMSWRPTPTVIVSIASEDGEQALAALDAGAVDIVQKPTALASDRLLEIGSELVSKIKVAATAHPTRVHEASIQPQAPRVFQASAFDVLVIGASTGGPQALREFIPRLPADLPVPVAIVLHMPVGYTQLYAERLNGVSRLEVREAREGDTLVPGRVLLAQAGRHLRFARSGSVVTAHLDTKPLDTLHRPSVDVLFASAGEVYGHRTLGLIFTGMGSDGTAGARRIREAGGTILAEAEESCVVYGMPRAAAEAGMVNQLVPLNEMSEAVLAALAGEVMSVE